MKLFKDNLIAILGFFGILTLIPIGVVIYKYFEGFGWSFPTTTGENPRADWGTFGDFFGGVLNPILGFASFMTLLYTLHLQSKELRNSNEQLAQSAKAQTEMEKTQRLQQFEGLFTYMANELSKIYENIRHDKSIDELLYRVSTHDWDEDKIIYEIRKNYNLTRFFIFLYQLLKYIKTNNLDSIEQKKYSNLIRSTIETPILQLLMFNSIKYEEFRVLLNDFNFLEHMGFDSHRGYSYNTIYAINFHDEEIFGESVYYDILKNSNILTKISSNKALSTPSKYFYELVMPKIGKVYEKTTELEQISSSIKLENIKIEIKDKIFSLTISPKISAPPQYISSPNDFLMVEKLLEANFLNRDIDYENFELYMIINNEIMFFVHNIDRYNVYFIFNNQSELRIFVTPIANPFHPLHREEFELLEVL